MQQPDLVVTIALPYANGQIHLGHLVEAIQADIWVRFHRLQGKSCLFLSGNDAHGTPIMLSSQKQNLSPEQLIEAIHQDHLRDFSAFQISFNQFHTTHSTENKQLTEKIYQTLQHNNMISTKTITQAFDEKAKMFLPDRYVRGTCPKCNASDQYGDACEQCGTTYQPLDLIDPISTISGTAPAEKQSEHYFFKLSECQEVLSQWLEQSETQTSVINKLKEWFAEGLTDWDITRDAPYFGFLIPGTEDKYFYVWLDAPIGYIASCQAYARQHGLDLDYIWQQDATTPLYHFIGKDIIYFHGLFWPATLNAAGLRMPTGLFAHGFLTIGGKKMSKSRGTFITAQQFLQHFEAEHLRYYFATKLSHKIEDIDLNWQDFIQKVNVDLVGKVINIASRTAKFIERDFSCQLYHQAIEHPLLTQFQETTPNVTQAFQDRDFSQACRLIMGLADLTNQYIAQAQPWQAIKDPNNQDQVHQTCTLALLCFRDLSILLKPILPELTKKIEQFLNLHELSWQDLHLDLPNHKIQPYQHLMQRIPTNAADHFSMPTTT